MAVYEYEVDLSFGELLKFQVYMFAIRMKLGLLVGIWVLAGLYMIAQVVSGQVALAESRVGFLVVFGLPLFIVVVTVVSTYRVYNQTWRPNLPMQFSVGAEGVSTTMPSTASQIRWSGIQEARTWGGLFLLFLNPHCALILPNRCLGDQLQEFRQYVNERLRRDV